MPKDTCNEEILTTVNFSQFIFVESIEIGDHTFCSVDTFRIDGLDRLKILKIGKNSFTRRKNCTEDGQSRSFHIVNCSQLKSVDIGSGSFSIYSGEFELKNLNSLSYLTIGEIGSDSFNFYSSAFILQGIHLRV